MKRFLWILLALAPAIAFGQGTRPPVTNFLGLTDTPDTYSGQAGKVVTVNPGATALEFGAAGGGSGTVTSITATTPIIVAPTPLTTTGIISLDPTKLSNWDTAFTDRLKWDGGATGLTAGTGRTSLGGTTLGQNFFTVANPGAIRFFRSDATNALILEDATTFRTSIGAGTSNFDGTFGSLTGKPTTLVGYGITDAQPLDGDLTSWAAITRAAGIDTFVTTPSSANLRTAVTDETGTSGGLVFAGSPTITSPTIAALANLTGNGFVKTSGGIGTLSVDTSTYLTANQSITLSSDVTGSGTTAITTTIASNAVTLAKMADMATDSILGRATAATGDPEVLASLPFAFTGDVTRAADSNAQTIATDAVTTAKILADNVTYAKMQNVSAASRLLGRGSASGAGDPEEILLGTNLSMSGTTLNASGGGGITDFLSLTDTPDSYVGQAGKVVAVNGGATGLEFIAAGGTGTVTNTGGALTANSVVLGAGGNDTKVVTGIISDGVSKLTLGVAATSVGSIDFKNATSGTVTIQPTTGALGTVTMTLPAANSNPVIPDTGAANNFLTAISGGGVISKAQPAFADLSGTISTTQGAPLLSNVAFAASWDAVTTIAPTKNVIHDWGVIFDTDFDGKVNVLDLTAGLVKTDGSGVVSTATAGTDYLTGNQSITLSSDVTGTGTTAITTTIASDAVTFAKFQNITTDKILGRATAASGDMEELGALPWALTGDVTTAADANATTIAAGAVTYAKMQDVSAASKLLGRGDGGAGDPQEITLGTNLSMSGTTLNATGGGGGAPTDATYLVATDHASLSADIAVGATPGGELGNTWASPTIDDSLSVTSWTLVTPTIAAISNLTGNGFVKTSGGIGTLSVDTSTYLTANQNISLTGEVTGGPAATSIATTIADSIAVSSWTLTTPAVVGIANFGNGATGPGEIRILEDTDLGSNYASFIVPSLAANTTYTLPADDGDAGEQLQTDGAGVLSWEAAGGGGGGAPTGVDYLVGTADGTLSAEIVVGTAPGGELGGTWDTPTIDDSVTVTGWVLGASTATTPAANDNDTSVATTAYVQGELPAATIVTTYTSGTAATHTVTSGCRAIFVEVWAGGGGGGGADSTASNSNPAGGGGGGGYAGEYIASPAASYIYTVGGAGSAGSATGATGGTGGTSSFGSNLCTATGGIGGVGSATGGTSHIWINAGGAGGAGTFGDDQRTGGQGTYGNRISATLAKSGEGGNAAGGGGGIISGRNAPEGAGFTGNAPGGGGSGALSTSTTGFAGGAGAVGRIRVTEYF